MDHQFASISTSTTAVPDRVALQIDAAACHFAGASIDQDRARHRNRRKLDDEIAALHPKSNQHRPASRHVEDK
jgi:hypothetical protein